MEYGTITVTADGELTQKVDRLNYEVARLREEAKTKKILQQLQEMKNEGVELAKNVFDLKAELITIRSMTRVVVEKLDQMLAIRQIQNLAEGRAKPPLKPLILKLPTDEETRRSREILDEFRRLVEGNISRTESDDLSE